MLYVLGIVQSVHNSVNASKTYMLPQISKLETEMVQLGGNPDRLLRNHCKGNPPGH